MPIGISEPDPIIRISKPDPIGKFKGLFYGDPGSGKTVLAGSADVCEFTGRALMVDAEAGDKPLGKFYPDIDRVPVKDLKDFNDIYEFLRKHVKLKQILNGEIRSDKMSPEDAKKKMAELESQLRGVEVKEPRIYNTVILDTLTEIQKYVMAHITGNDPDTIDFSGEFKMPTLNDWGRNSEIVRSIVRTFRNLDLHVIFTCHAAEVKDEQTGAVEILPSLPGRLAREVMGYVDVVGYLYVKETDDGEFRNVLITRNTGKYQAKDRFDALGPYIENPTMDKIIKKIKEAM